MIHERKDGVAFVTVNRPGARNAFRDVATRGEKGNRRLFGEKTARFPLRGEAADPSPRS